MNPFLLFQRTNSPYYHLNLLLCLPLPILLSISLLSSSSSSSTKPSLSHSLLAIFLTPLFLSLTALNSSWTSLEAFLDRAYWLLELFNVIGLFLLRKSLGVTGWTGLAYLVAWLVISFFFPQPAYLGPSKLSLLNSDEFDEQILLLPPAESVSDVESSKPPKITELPPSLTKEEKLRSHVVLFHADWIRKSRELEISVARLSWSLSSTTLSFHILTPLSAPQTYYDFALATHAGTTDLPVLMVFQNGKLRGRLPAGKEEVEKENWEKRELGKRDKTDKVKGTSKGKGKESEDESVDGDGEDSEDEREVEREVAMRRYRWDKSEDAIMRDFKLKERSEGKELPPVPTEKKSSARKVKR